MKSYFLPFMVLSLFFSLKDAFKIEDVRKQRAEKKTQEIFASQAE